MNPPHTENIHHIFSQFTPTRVTQISKLESGIINLTFAVETETGEKYILQRLVKALDNRAILDMHAITNHLKAKGEDTLTIVPTRVGQLWHTDETGYLWKLMTAVEGEVFSVLPSAALAFEAGKLLAQFHSGLADFPPNKLQSTLKLHDTKQILADFKQIYLKLMDSDINMSSKVDLNFIFEELPKVVLPENLPQSVIHGDTKISNFIFLQGSGVCIIDLDTCMLNSPLVDLGDAFRSWCGKEEDDQNNEFSLEYFSSGLQGYLSVHSLSENERKYVLTSILMITLELAARFAIDIVHDNYFSWSSDKYTSRKAHNIARVRGQVKLARDIQRKKQDIDRAMSSLCVKSYHSANLSYSQEPK